MPDWKVTDRERLALNLLIERGSQKIVALEMGISGHALSDKYKQVRERNGGIRTNMLLALEWDRDKRK